MIDTSIGYGLRVEVDHPYEKAVERTRDALSAEGFGVLTEIDVRATLKKKLDVDFQKYIILGACNPPLAHKALSAERDIGLLLPCNVVVYEGSTPQTSVVAAIEPEQQLQLAGNEAIRPIAEEVRGRLERVLQAVAG